MVIFFVGLEMVGQVGDSFTEKRNLNLGRTRIRCVLLELPDQGGLFIRGECHVYIVCCVKRPKKLLEN